MQKNSLVWFKNDLRLLDNEALSRAVEDSDQVVYFYCIDERNYKKLELGFKKTSALRLKFLHQSLRNLRNNLESLRAHLIIKSGKTEEEIKSVVDQYKITAIYAEQEYADEELKIINSVKQRLPEMEYHFYWGKTLYHLNDIPFSIDKIPLTSKAYRIPTSKNASIREIFEIPANLKSHPEAKSTKMPSFTSLQFTKSHYENAKPLMPGGEDKALERLEYYSFKTETLTSYRWTRNRSLGLDYSSKFSPYLALGCISARTIYYRVKDYEKLVKKNQSTWWIIFELVWRDYFTFKHMRFGNQIFQTEGFKNKKIEFENDQAKFERCMNGMTGIPFVDAHMRQLNNTGFMSNRGRVNCSSYFIHDLKIDWTWGAAYFENKLIDYDVSSNWMNWHAQAYEIWYTNPVHQSNKYKAQEFIQKWIPELANEDDQMTLLPWLIENTSYPEPIEIYKKWNRSVNKILRETK